MRRTTLALIGLAICTASVVAWVWGLYEVTRIGTCASGGPYVSARPCPEGTGIRILALMGGIFGGLIGLGVYAGGRPKHGRAAAGLGTMLWFFLFAGGAAAMLLSGFGPARQDNSGKVVAVTLSVVFIPMGVIPLLGAIGWRSGRKRLASAGGLSAASPAPPPSPRTMSPPPSAPAAPKAAPAFSGDPLDRLSQLEQLRKQGVVDETEFERLKAEILRDA
jgi:hypothetical protein